MLAHRWVGKRPVASQLLAGALLGSLLACGTDADPGGTGPTPELTAATGPLAASTVCQDLQLAGLVDPVHPCNASRDIFVDVANTTLRGKINAALDSALDDWNAALHEFPAGALPNFAVVSDSNLAEITLTVRGGTTGPWCGEGFRTNGPYLQSGCAASTATTSIGTLLRHEVGHLYGITDFRETQAANASVPGVSDQCIMYLGTDPPAGKICQHDLELIYAGYGHGDRTRIESGNFFAQHIATGVNTNPSSVTVEETKRVTVTATSFEFRRSGGGTPSVTVPSSLALAWTLRAENPAIVSLLASGTSATVTGENQGGTDIYLDVTNPATLPAGVTLSTKLAQAGDTLDVTVTPTPYRITDIVGPDDPIKTAGHKLFHIESVGQPDGWENVVWIVDRNTWDAEPPIVDTLTFQALSVYVESGTYPMRVTAQAYVVDGQPTNYRTENWSVCTGPQLAGKQQAQPDGDVGVNGLPGCVDEGPY